MALETLLIVACQICLPLPKVSTADVLLAADVVAFAREDPRRPFQFLLSEVIKGKCETRQTDVFVDTLTRRRLAAEPERVVLLARKDDGPWRRLGSGGAALREGVRALLARARDWSPSERVRFVARWLDHEEPSLAQLAKIEVARAPYGEIRRIRGMLPRETIHVALRNFRLIEWHPLYILLLAPIANDRDKEFIAESFGTSSGLRLAAWATAYIETDPDKALPAIEQRFGEDEKVARELVRALSLHGTEGRTELRDRIVASYRSLLARQPGLASPVLDDLIAWERSDMTAFLRAFAADHARTLPPDARLKLARFLR